jgi:hypothetical protein
MEVFLKFMSTHRNQLTDITDTLDIIYTSTIITDTGVLITDTPDTPDITDSSSRVLTGVLISNTPGPLCDTIDTTATASIDISGRIMARFPQVMNWYYGLTRATFMLDDKFFPICCTDDIGYVLEEDI